MWSSLTALTLSELQVSYKVACLANDDVRDKAIKALNDNYIKALDRSGAEAKREGDLDAAIQIEQEIADVKKKAWPLPQLSELLEKRIGKSRSIYLKGRLSIEQKWALATSKAADKMIEALKVQKLDLTQKGELKLAQKAQSQIEAISQDPKIILAREFPKRFSKSGKPKVAYTIRRQGDDVEVLVRYDSAGEISFKSPVENIREKTGKGGERGDTKAANLGEFVGAAGFEADPVVVFDEKGESGKIVFDEIFGVEVEKKVSFAKKDGVQFTLVDGVENAYIGMNGILAPLSEPATFKLTCEYFIPKTNHKVTGLLIRHGNSTQGANFKQGLGILGRWTTGTSEGTSGSADGLLRFHMAGPQFKDYAKASGDKFLFRSLKIEFTTTSAAIVESFGANGELISEQKEKTSQKLLVSNGSLLSN